MSRFLSQARILRSLYTMALLGLPWEGVRLSAADCARRSLVLFDRMLEQAGRAGDTSERLMLLTSACALLRDTTMVTDFGREDRWLELAEAVTAQGLREAVSRPSLGVSLCLCLADYYYQTEGAEDDSGYCYLCDTLDAWAASFVPGRGWADAGLAEAMARLLVMNRYSYMFLDASRDAVIRDACRLCAGRMKVLPTVSTTLLELWYALNTEGNACPLDEAAARDAAARLARFGNRFPSDSDEWLLGRSYRLAWECRKQTVLSVVE